MAGTIATDRSSPGIAVVTITHPGKKNALTEAMWQQLAETFRQLAHDPDLRAVVITGSNGDFAAGGDLSEFPTVRATFDRALHYHEAAVRPALLAIRDCPVAVIAAVEGACVGGGLEIALLCDWIIAAENARFGAPVGKLAFAVYPGELELLANRLPRAILARMLLECHLLPPEPLAKVVVVAEVTPAGTALTHALAAAKRAAAADPAASRAHKSWLNRLTTPGAPLLSENERFSGAMWAESSTHRERLAAFLAKNASPT